MVKNRDHERETIKILEMDELYTYIKKKKIKHEYGLLLIGTDSKMLRLKYVAAQRALMGPLLDALFLCFDSQVVFSVTKRVYQRGALGINLQFSEFFCMSLLRLLRF